MRVILGFVVIGLWFAACWCLLAFCTGCIQKLVLVEYHTDKPQRVEAEAAPDAFPFLTDEEPQ